jgi:23S rRNA pseudouridine2604 synthase
VFCETTLPTAKYNGDMTKKLTLTTKKTASTTDATADTLKTASAPRTHASGARAIAAKRRTRGGVSTEPVAAKPPSFASANARTTTKLVDTRSKVASGEVRKRRDTNTNTTKTSRDGDSRRSDSRGSTSRGSDARKSDTRHTETRDSSKYVADIRPKNSRSGRPLPASFTAPSSTPSALEKPVVDDGTVRLSKLMSIQGIASRREADEWIAKGWVKVDDVVVDELGTRILPTQIITVSTAAKKEQESRVTILLNKPVGYVSGQAEDGHQPASVLFIAENRWENDDAETQFHPMQAKGLAPAGRLDIDSVGLIVFTQDGRVAKQLIGDNSEVEKEYLVRVTGELSDADLKLLNHGLSLEGKALRPAEVSWQNEDQLRFVLREGKKRQIRHMCEMVGLTVVGLKRIRIGKIMLGNLPPGKWRYLSANESFD